MASTASSIGSVPMPSYQTIKAAVHAQAYGKPMIGYVTQTVEQETSVPAVFDKGLQRDPVSGLWMPTELVDPNHITGIGLPKRPFIIGPLLVNEPRKKPKPKEVFPGETINTLAELAVAFDMCPSIFLPTHPCAYPTARARVIPFFRMAQWIKEGKVRWAVRKKGDGHSSYKARVHFNPHAKQPGEKMTWAGVIAPTQPEMAVRLARAGVKERKMAARNIFPLRAPRKRR